MGVGDGCLHLQCLQRVCKLALVSSGESAQRTAALLPASSAPSHAISAPAHVWGPLLPPRLTQAFCILPGCVSSPSVAPHQLGCRPLCYTLYVDTGLNYKNTWLRKMLGVFSSLEMKAGSGRVPALPGGRVLPKPLAESCKKVPKQEWLPSHGQQCSLWLLLLPPAPSRCRLTKARHGKPLTLVGKRTVLERLRVLLLFWQRWRDYT